MAARKTPEAKLRALIDSRTLGLIEALYDIAEGEETSATSRLTAIRELLDRTVGKGTVLPSEQATAAPIEIVFRMEDA